MIGIVLALSIQATPVALLATPLDARRRISRCGIPLRRIRSIDVGGGDVMLEVDDGVSPAATVLQCVADASRAMATDVVFKDRKAQSRLIGLQDAFGKRQARNWLASHGLLAKLPPYARDQSLAGFGVAIERACGAAPGSWLAAASPHLLTLSPSRLDPTRLMMGTTPEDDRIFSCIVKMIGASDLSVHGGGFGFVGNAARPDAVMPSPNQSPPDARADSRAR